jgi:predicted aldo/keto reductase-like oxidoreductase
MRKRDISRRDFIETSTLGTAGILTGCSSTSKMQSYNDKGLPTTILGKTGVRIPRIALGCGSRFLAAKPDQGLEMLEYALDQGLYYWDTANSYINNDTKEASEERLGQILKNRRKEVFLGTKLGARDPEELKRQFETSLKRLQTDHVDILNMHSIASLEDAQNLTPIVKILEDYRRQGMTRFIGFTGHTTAEGMAYAADNYGLDFMLCALNHYQKGEQPFETNAVPTAAKNKMGIMVMKVIRPRETVENVTPRQLIRYALSLPHAHGAIISMSDLGVMKANIELLKTFKPMSKAEMDSMAVVLDPFYQSDQLEWMQPGYKDGVWV